jgi:hypothetical protein
MSYRHPRLAGGKVIRVDGCSHLRGATRSTATGIISMPGHCFMNIYRFWAG